MLTEMRREVQAVLARCEVKRTPVLRRAEMADALLSTDLPTVASPEMVMAFREEMTARGWRVRQAVIWLLLDKPVPMPPADPGVTAQGETGCCLSLLTRHPDAAYDADAVRAIVKAAEQNAMALEKVCARLHEKWAEKLRMGQPLPGQILPYLQEAVKEVARKC